MSNHGYIYVKNWRKYQHGNAGLPWHKVYGALLHDDAYCELTLADRGTLHGLWMLASLTGDGRVSASRTYLARHLNVRRVSLEPLIQAGWIEIRLDKAESKSSTDVDVDREGDVEEEPSTPIPSSKPAANGSEPTTALPHALLRILDDRIPPQLKPGQVALATQAWEYNDVEIRHSLAAVEAADNPTAYFVSVCRRILPSKEPTEAKPRSSVTWPKGIPAA
jgi:hypothetical protein